MGVVGNQLLVKNYSELYQLIGPGNPVSRQDFESSATADPKMVGKEMKWTRGQRQCTVPYDVPSDADQTTNSCAEELYNVLYALQLNQQKKFQFQPEVREA
jgi:hypothetical protein